MMQKLDKYEKIQKIGEGTYGIVWKCKDSYENMYAVKKIKLDNDQEGVPSTAMRQISILKQLQPHPNIVGLKQVQYVPYQKKLLLVFQFVDNDLRKHLKSIKGKLTSYEVKLIMFQLFNGVHFCHSRRIIHRDLKPQNILISKQGIIKIADFGLARAFSLPIKTLTHQIQTLWYRAPQVLLGQKQYSLGVDIWALGCIFAQLVQKKPIFQGDCQIDQLFKMFQFFGTPTFNDWPNLSKLPDFKPSFPKFKPQNPQNVLPNFDRVSMDLLLKLIALDPSKRISVKQALKHPYFADLKKDDVAQFII